MHWAQFLMQRTSSGKLKVTVQVEKEDARPQVLTALGHICAIKGHSCVAGGWCECWRLPEADWSAQMGHGRSLLSALQRSAQLQLSLQLPEARKLPHRISPRLVVRLQTLTRQHNNQHKCYLM